MRPIPKLLSKTKLLRGYRCLKCIYLTIHQPELEAPITPATQALFDQGNEVGAAARRFFPGGVLIDNPPWDFVGALEKTRALIAAGTPVIYEAAFTYQGCYARADIIQYSPATKRWRIYEVKSTTKVKPEHYDDVGLQTWIMAKSGLPIEQIHLLHLNPACRYPDLSNLFMEVDVTETLRANYLKIQPTLHNILTTIRKKELEPTDIGPHCLEPTECGFINHCWKEKNIPEMSVFDLPGIRQRKWALYHEGVIALDDPRLTDLNELQQRIISVYRSGQRYLNAGVIRQALASWEFPLVFLDFETINPALPRYHGCGPYHQVPFQFSVHVWEHPQADITHHAFLHDQASDPRPTLIPALIAACGTQGSIVAYYSQFEASRIQELIQYSPADSEALQALVERMVDPLPIFREAVYDNAFKGSFSLKSVAPGILGEEQGYAGMEIADGNAAQRAFEELIAEKTSLQQKQRIREAMLAYCEKDTEVMVELVKWLYAVAAASPEIK